MSNQKIQDNMMYFIKIKFIKTISSLLRIVSLLQLNGKVRFNICIVIVKCSLPLSTLHDLHIFKWSIRWFVCNDLPVYLGSCTDSHLSLLQRHNYSNISMWDRLAMYYITHCYKVYSTFNPKQCAFYL